MERIPLAEAAQRLGITVDATRKRIKRGLLAGTKGADGRWYVTLPEEGEAERVDNAAMRVSTRMDEDLRAEVAFLRERLQEAETERAELRRMLNLEQQSVARLLPATVSAASRATVSDDDTGIVTPPPNAPQRGAGKAERASQEHRRRGWFVRLMGWE